MHMQTSLTSSLIRFQTGIFYLVVALMPLLPLWITRGSSILFVIVALIPLGFFLRHKPWNTILHAPLARIILIWFGFALISLIWTMIPQKGFILWVQLLFMFLGTYALIQSIPSFNQESRVTILWILVSTLTLALCITNIELFFGGPITRYVHSFCSKPYEFTPVDFNRAAVVMTLIAWPALYFLWNHEHKIYALALYALTLVTILRLESQSASMALLVGSLILPVLWFSRKKGIRVLIFSIPIVCIAIPIAAINMDPEVIFEKLPSLPHAAMEYRLHIWHFAALKAQLHPWFGWGFEASRSIPIQPDEYLNGHRSPLPLHPHNNILQVWLELGIMGLMIFSAFLITLLQTIRELNSPAKIAFSCSLMSTFFAIGSTGYGIWQHWFIAAGIIASILLMVAMKSSKLSD